MIYSFDTQLQVVLRALNDVVAPALADAEKHVLEQFGLSTLMLSFMQQRLPHARRFCRMELTAWIALAGDVTTLLAENPPGDLAALNGHRDAGEAALAAPDAENEDFIEISRAIRDAITAQVAAAVDHRAKSALDALLLERNDTILTQQRQWCQPLGLDPAAADLPAPAWLTRRRVR